jgi:hypothetical protein
MVGIPPWVIKKSLKKWDVRPIQGMIKSNRGEKSTGIAGKPRVFSKKGVCECNTVGGFGVYFLPTVECVAARYDRRSHRNVNRDEVGRTGWCDREARREVDLLVAWFWQV